jgi:hypothetical protein
MKTAPFLLVLTLSACEKQQALSHMPREEAVQLAREAAQDAFTQLSGELAKAMENGGPAAAIPICSERARPLVAEVASRRQVGLLRLSDRPRNPQQKASGRDLATIEAFRTAILNGTPPEPAVEAAPNGATLVRLPIIISQPLCLQCHGTDADIAVETRAALKDLYPVDQATGYQLNDLRGIWQVTLGQKGAP